MGQLSTTASRTLEPLPGDALTIQFFQRMEEEGHDMQPYRYMLRAPGSVPSKHLLEMAQDLKVDFMDLLQAGLGVWNTFEEIDRAIGRRGDGSRLGVIVHEA